MIKEAVEKKKKTGLELTGRELRCCVKVGMAVLGSPSMMMMMS